MRILQTPVDLERSLEEHHNYIRLQKDDGHIPADQIQSEKLGNQK